MRAVIAQHPDIPGITIFIYLEDVEQLIAYSIHPNGTTLSVTLSPTRQPTMYHALVRYHFGG